MILYKPAKELLMGFGANVRSEHDHENAPFETCTDKEFDHRPEEEFQDFECRKLITRILLALQIYENQTSHQRGAQKFRYPHGSRCDWQIWIDWRPRLKRLSATQDQPLSRSRDYSYRIDGKQSGKVVRTSYVLNI